MLASMFPHADRGPGRAEPRGSGREDQRREGQEEGPAEQGARPLGSACTAAVRTALRMNAGGPARARKQVGRWDAGRRAGDGGGRGGRAALAGRKQRSHRQGKAWLGGTRPATR